MQQFTGKEGYLGFGNFLHIAFANYPINNVFACTPTEAKKLTAMVAKLYANKIVLALVKDSVREVSYFASFFGINVRMILDVRQPTTGSDLKSTDCRSFADFLAKAIEYGYFRQALIYMLGVGLKDFYFIGICKEPPFEIFIFNVNDYPKELAYAREELDFLLYWYRSYGKVILPK